MLISQHNTENILKNKEWTSESHDSPTMVIALMEIKLIVEGPGHFLKMFSACYRKADSDSLIFSLSS